MSVLPMIDPSTLASGSMPMVTTIYFPMNEYTIGDFSLKSVPEWGNAKIEYVDKYTARLDIFNVSKFKLSADRPYCMIWGKFPYIAKVRVTVEYWPGYMGNETIQTRSVDASIENRHVGTSGGMMSVGIGKKYLISSTTLSLLWPRGKKPQFMAQRQLLQQPPQRQGGYRPAEFKL